MKSNRSSVLCVEDDLDTREMLKVLLEGQGCQFIAVDNCEKALEVIASTDLSLVLTDNVLPDGTGIDLCAEVRKVDERLPVIFLSGSTFEDEQEMAFKAGANAFLTKPVTLAEFFAVLSNYIQLSDTQP